MLTISLESAKARITFVLWIHVRLRFWKSFLISSLFIDIVMNTWSKAHFLVFVCLTLTLYITFISFQLFYAALYSRKPQDSNRTSQIYWSHVSFFLQYSVVRLLRILKHRTPGVETLMNPLSNHRTQRTSTLMNLLM